MKKAIVVLLLGLMTSVSKGQSLTDSLKKDWQRKHTAKQSALKEFNEAKFGMFIHWGLYAQLAGEWQGEKAPGLRSCLIRKCKFAYLIFRNIILVAAI